MSRRIRILSLLSVLSLLGVACGAEPDSGGTTSVSETTSTVAETTTTAAETTTTALATTTTAAAIPEVVPGADPDVDAVVDLYAVVFDSSTSYEDKAALIVDPEGLEETVASYAASGDAVGGVSAEVTGVRIDDGAADLVYTLLFNGNPTYPGLEGEAVLTDDGWKVTRETFCGIMASARTACPTG